MDSKELKIDKMDLCKCQEQPIIYYCKDTQCQARDIQPYYCQLCMEKGLHKHFSHHRIVTIIEEKESEWNSLHESFKELNYMAQLKYEELEPLILYFQDQLLKLASNSTEYMLSKDPIKDLTIEIH
ncbi:hypothetical protein FGO68_gene5228 [Halteria grandinella]|uniref:Uncharacterized protein n=1 Tax=Halteria grandinella TaxID=5974 RepID=A0A8J8SUB4_HALGN|nr:hypothetical protein FGO68_gene5228 [Halteria grandinella]